MMSNGVCVDPVSIVRTLPSISARGAVGLIVAVALSVQLPTVLLHLCPMTLTGSGGVLWPFCKLFSCVVPK